MTAGSLGAAALIAFAPDPLHRVYEVLLGLTVLMIALLWVMPESISRKAGALASLRPHVGVPRQSRSILVRLTPANIASWALGGLYLSLMPTVVATAMGVASPWVGGVVVSALMLTAAIAVATFRHWPARRLILTGTSTLSLGVAVSMFGIHAQQVAALLAGTVIAGAGIRARPSRERCARCCRRPSRTSGPGCFPRSTCSPIWPSACRRSRRACRSR